MNTTSKSWVFGLVTIFGLGILFVTFSMVFSAYLRPNIEAIITGSNFDANTESQALDGIARYMIFYNALPFILFIIVCIFMMVAGIRKEGESQYY